jgi:UPF0716 protein FxsA
MFLLIVAAFPCAEGALLYRLAAGPGGSGAWVLAWLVFATIAGMVLLKQARFSLLARLATALSQGRYSLAALIESFRAVFAGLLLIFPGLLSDAMAFALLLWPVREPELRPVAAGRPGRPAIIDAGYRRDEAP